MKPKSKKLSLIEETHHKEDAQASSSLFDFTLLSQALNASEIGIKNRSSSISEDSNPVQSLSKGGFDFTGLSETLNGIQRQNQKYAPQWDKMSFCMKKASEIALRRRAMEIVARNKKRDLAKITHNIERLVRGPNKFWRRKLRRAIRMRAITRPIENEKDDKRVIVMEESVALYICI